MNTRHLERQLLPPTARWRRGPGPLNPLTPGTRLRRPTRAYETYVQCANFAFSQSSLAEDGSVPSPGGLVVHSTDSDAMTGMEHCQ